MEIPKMNDLVVFQETSIWGVTCLFGRSPSNSELSSYYLHLKIFKDYFPIFFNQHSLKPSIFHGHVPAMLDDITGYWLFESNINMVTSCKWCTNIGVEINGSDLQMLEYPYLISIISINLSSTLFKWSVKQNLETISW